MWCSREIERLRTSKQMSCVQHCQALLMSCRILQLFIAEQLSGDLLGRRAAPAHMHP